MAKQKSKTKEVEETEQVAQKEENKTIKPPTEFNLQIKTVFNKEDSSWSSVWNDTDKEGKGIEYKGIGDTPLSSIRNLIDNIELENIKDEVERYNRYLLLHFDEAKALTLQFADMLGLGKDTWFTIYQVMVKTRMKKEQVFSQLKLLKTYGLVQVETKKEPTANSRWKIVWSKELQVKELQDRKKVLEHEVSQVDYQLKNLLLNESKQQDNNKG